MVFKMSNRNLYLIYLFFLIIVPLQSINGQAINDSLILSEPDTIQLVQGQQGSMGSYYYKVFLATGIVILLLISVMYVFKKLGGQALSQNRTKIQVLSRQNIGPKQSVVIVAIENKKYALGVTDQTINLLSELGEVQEDELPSNEIKQVSQNFSAILEKLKKKR